MVLLKRLYIENYKLFSRKEFDFSKALLSVFDGPNGYGKTSIFDAIELLVTGKIIRILNCESIDGKQAYQTVFFAQNSKKDVILKAEFEDTEKQRNFVLGARVKSTDINGKIANPKNIFDKIEYFYLPSYTIPIDSWNEYARDSEKIEEIRKQEFGQQNIEQFTLFHYIRQEDRLLYFKQSESSRAATIESLLGVTKESEKFKKILTRRKSIDGICKKISTELDNKKARVLEVNGYSNQPIEYKPLLIGKQVWDQERVFFGDTNKEKVLEQYFAELERIESYVKFADLHIRYFSYVDYIKIPEVLRNDAIRALILLQTNPVTVDEIDTAFQTLLFLKKERENIHSQEYRLLDFSKINNALNIQEDISLILGIESLNEISRHQSDLQKSLNNVLKMRDNLNQSHVKISKNGICPYCGYDWKSQEELHKQFDLMKEILQNLLTQDGEMYARQLEIIRNQIEHSILVRINNKIEELSKKDILKIYEKFKSKEQFVTSIEKARSIFNLCNSQLKARGLEFNNNEYFEKMFGECISIGNMIPNDYIAANVKYNFFEISKKYSMDRNLIIQLKKENFEQKRQYLQEQFYKSFDSIKDEIKKLETQKNSLEELQRQLKEYENAVKRAIELYKKQVIDEIEIPFFVYSSRLLQSYQGGQGVLMKNDGGSIRFTSPGKEHDILYTMSSGQLSAVLLSFSLALNKIYSGNGIKTVLIDDPVQCMDDINMISFVELLRREFCGSQIILSTHEEDFSNFIRYKFKKYGLGTQAITLKDA